MNRKWKIAAIIGIFSVTSALYMWGIPAIVNIKAHKSSIEKTIFESSGYRVKLGNPELSMGWFPSVWISSDNISVLNDDNSKALSIDNPKLKLKLFPLLRKKIEISKLSASKEDVYFVFTKDSKFLLGQYPLKFEKKDSKFTLSKMDMNFGEYNIYLDDKKNSQKVSLCGNYFEHGKYVANKHVKFATEGILNVGDKATKLFSDVEISLPIDSLSEDQFKINAKIDDFDISSISDYIAILTGGKKT